MCFVGDRAYEDRRPTLAPCPTAARDHRRGQVTGRQVQVGFMLGCEPPQHGLKHDFSPKSMMWYRWRTPQFRVAVVRRSVGLISHVTHMDGGSTETYGFRSDGGSYSISTGSPLYWSVMSSKST